ncbi:hypothetical protein DE146DRAFT_707341 [Phaeosphaeria sp. MPI-PUGE-AT-0046c]|nr:hypothetical protein DE146DRAFT_707341 [Phaeosphaeria sp. MPI-PUGE-AT-0046c]
MATPKRKRKTARATPNKRPYAERSDVELSDSEPLWDAERILDERVRNRKLQYLIEWKGCDPATGEAYAPSWEPKESPTPDLVKEWKQKKAADTRPARQSLQDRPAPRRPSRLVESSPEPSTAPSTIASAVAGPTASPPLPQHPSPAIHVRPRGSSFDPDDYERFTQLPPTQRPSPPPDAQESDLDSSRLFAAAPVYLASGVVPDSQSSVGEGSFLPATHQTTGTTQHSSTAADSQDDVTQDSGLLDIVQQSTSRAPSPAQSIPETIYDTAVEPQTLRQQSVSQAADDSFGLTEDDEEQDHQQDDHLQSGHQRVEEADDQLRNNCPSDCAAPASTYPVAQTSSTPETIVAQANDQLFNDVDAWDPVARIEQVDRSTVPDVVEGRPRPESEDIQVRPTESGKPQVEDNRSQQGPDDSSRHYSRSPLALDSIFCLEQNAQAVHSNNDLSTQDDTTETIWPTVEKADFTAQSSPGSRHDSSQDTPEPGASLHSRSSSPIGPPPSDSLVTQASNAPARPRTPVPTSSLTIMSTPPDPVALLDRKLKERQVERLRRRAERHATDSPGPATATPAPAATLTDTSNVQLRLLRTGPSPSVPLTEGTRSPSTVPDRFPAPQAPTSLRTVAHAQASKALSGDSHDEETRVLSVNATVESKESAAHATAAVPAITTSEATMADIDSSDNEYLHEVSDQSEATEHSAPSLLEEDPDLNLAVNERIIPLSLHGRQRDQYSIILGGKKDKLEEFLDDPQSFEPLTEIEGLLSKLRDLENHFDLIYEEASLPAQDEADNDIQPPRAVVFGLDNSVKFRFLWRLFAAMRSQDKHVLLVTQDNSDALYLKLEQLCRALAINYKIPTKNCQAEPTRISGDLLVTIFPSTSAPIIRPADLIICLDGAQEATQIRRKNWAINPKIDFVPIFHLVIPRTLGHIERCLSSPSNDRERMHTILACLAQFKKELGSPINGEDIKAADAATRVAEWLDNNDNGGEEWPLESIGSVAEVIEYVTQRSQESATPPAAERSKRPHEDEVLDPAKRMRFTPQPPDVLSSSVIENEVTRISDSMPGTATDDASILRAQLTYMESILKKDGIERQSEQARFQEAEIMWNRQQTEYEDLSRQHRLLQSGLKESNEKIDALTKSNDSYRERLATRTEEARIAAAQLKEERDTHLLSTDEKIAEITKLRNELAEAIQEKERAVKSAASANSTLEYTKDQYRTAQDAATTSAVMVASLEAQNARLSHAASAERTKLKAMHLDRQHMSVVATNKTLRVENAILKKTLANKEDELARAKQNGGRMGVGTRATSVTPQPNRVRSRAGSPSVGSSRLSNLRNG